MNKEVVYSPLAFKEEFKVSLENENLTVKSSGDKILKALYKDGQLQINDCNNLNEKSLLVLHSMEYLFGQYPETKTITLNEELKGYPFNFLGKEIRREEFFQIPLLWTLPKTMPLGPERWTESKGVTHPVRERLPEGIFYRKHIPQIDKTLTLRLITENDLETFHEWHNQPRVSHFWELNRPKEELLKYIQNGLKDPHQFPVIVELDGVKAGYYEFYWVKEDRLGPYYDSEAFDRGFHFLIGNKDFLGFKTTDSLIKTVLHFLFLDDPRTRKIMAEPRHDNQKVLRYAEASIGWKKLKEFDFPHKRAALLENRRELFFGGHAL